MCALSCAFKLLSPIPIFLFVLSMFDIFCNHTVSSYEPRYIFVNWKKLCLLDVSFNNFGISSDFSQSLNCFNKTSVCVIACTLDRASAAVFLSFYVIYVIFLFSSACASDLNGRAKQ